MGRVRELGESRRLMDAKGELRRVAAAVAKPSAFPTNDITPLMIGSHRLTIISYFLLFSSICLVPVRFPVVSSQTFTVLTQGLFAL